MCSILNLKHEGTQQPTRKENKMKEQDHSKEQRMEWALQVIDIDLLIAAANGELDIQEAIAKNMANRGRNKKGDWVGFEAAKKIWKK